MIYKIYAQCVRKPVPIERCYHLDKDDVVRETANINSAYYFDTVAPEIEADDDFEKEYQFIWEKLALEAADLFDGNHYIPCGDFYFLNTEEEYPTRPNAGEYMEVCDE